jgi:hypothetical protein
MHSPDDLIHPHAEDVSAGKALHGTAAERFRRGLSLGFPMDCTSRRAGIS